MSSILTNTSAMVALQTMKGINASLNKTQADIATGKNVASAKDTALASAISIIELLKAGLSQKALLANPSPLIFVAVVYLMLFIPLTQFAGFLERRMKKSQRQVRL